MRIYLTTEAANNVSICFSSLSTARFGLVLGSFWAHSGVLGRFWMLYVRSGPINLLWNTQLCLLAFLCSSTHSQPASPLVVVQVVSH